MLRPLYVHARSHLPGYHGRDAHEPVRQRSPSPTAHNRRRRVVKGPWTLEFTWPTLGTLRASVADKLRLTSVSGGTSASRTVLRHAGRPRGDDGVGDGGDDGRPEGDEGPGEVDGGGGGGGGVPLEPVDSSGAYDLELGSPGGSASPRQVHIETAYFGRKK